MKKEQPTTPPTHRCQMIELGDAFNTVVDFDAWVPTREQRVQDNGIMVRLTIKDNYRAEMIVWGFMPASFVYNEERYRERPEDAQFE